MRNPVEKDNRLTLIIAAAIASAAAGTIVFLFFTEKGNDARKALKKKIKSIAKGAVIDATSKKTKIKKKAIKAVADHVVE
jgi:hypothetical protein